MTRHVARNLKVPCSTLQDSLLEAVQRFLFGVVGIKDREQFRDHQEVGNPLGEIQELEVTTLPAHGRVGLHDFAKPPRYRRRARPRGSG